MFDWDWDLFPLKQFERNYFFKININTVLGEREKNLSEIDFNQGPGSSFSEELLSCQVTAIYFDYEL